MEPGSEVEPVAKGPGFFAMAVAEVAQAFQVNDVVGGQIVQTGGEFPFVIDRVELAGGRQLLGVARGSLCAGVFRRDF